MFHKHKWKEIVRTYQPSAMEGMNTSNGAKIPVWAFESKTTILWECEICQNLRKEEMEGKIIS